MSEHKSTHSSQINTSFPAINLNTSFGFLPQKVIAFQQASDGAIRYRARLDFSPLQDGIESAEPNYLYASSLIKDLDREVKNFAQTTTKR